MSRYFKIGENMYNFMLQAMFYYSDLEQNIAAFLKEDFKVIKQTTDNRPVFCTNVGIEEAKLQ